MVQLTAFLAPLRPLPFPTLVSRNQGRLPRPRHPVLGAPSPCPPPLRRCSGVGASSAPPPNSPFAGPAFSSPASPTSLRGPGALGASALSHPGVLGGLDPAGAFLPYCSPLSSRRMSTGVAHSSGTAGAGPSTSSGGADGAVEERQGGPVAGQGLETQNCVPCHSKSVQPMQQAEAEALLLQELPGWQLAEVEGVLRLRRTWKTKNFLAGLEFFGLIAGIAEAQGHHPDLHLEGWNNARVDIFTHSIGGLHKNDFILAAKIEALDASGLMRKPKKSIA